MLAVLGIDTSCYTTSVAAVTLEGQVLSSVRRLLVVKMGGRGLRQSEGVFQHVQNLPELLALLREEDILMVTADHGCDPSTPSTDHSREYIPFVAAGRPVKAGSSIGTRNTFADIGMTVLDYFGLASGIDGQSFLSKILSAEK